MSDQTLFFQRRKTSKAQIVVMHKHGSCPASNGQNETGLSFQGYSKGTQSPSSEAILFKVTMLSPRKYVFIRFEMHSLSAT